MLTVGRLKEIIRYMPDNTVVQIVSGFDVFSEADINFRAPAVMHKNGVLVGWVSVFTGKFHKRAFTQ